MPGAPRQAPIEVTVAVRGQEIVAGTLWVHERGEQSATFRYTDEYLSSPDSYDLDPALPKSSGVFQTPAGRAMFSAFADSAPDRWGENLRSIDRQVHADLADAAKRREYQFLCGLCHDQVPPRPNTSPAVTVASPPGCSTCSRPASSSPWKRPRISRSGRRTRMSSPSPAARASQSAADACKAVAALPLRQPAQHRRRQRGQQHLRRHHRAGLSANRSPGRPCRADGWRN